MRLFLALGCFCLFLMSASDGHAFVPVRAPASESQIVSVVATAPAYRYPIKDASRVLPEHDTVVIFAYGSLLNSKSAATTLTPKSMKTYKKAIALGVKRLYNRHAPNSKKWGPQPRPNDTAALNIEYTGDTRSMINGVIFEVDRKDLQSLVDREFGYDLVPVSVILWDETTSNNPKAQPQTILAYTFMASKDPREGVIYAKSGINPIPNYGKATYEGAAENGDTFLQFWLDTTFLSDGVTSIREWLKNPLIDCSERVCKPQTQTWGHFTSLNPS